MYNKLNEYSKINIDHNGGEKHAVQPVHHAAVTGKDGAKIFNAAMTLDERSKQIADLPRKAAGQPQNKKMP